MKYQPSLPEHNDNVSHQHPVREFFILMAGVLSFVLIGYWVLGLVVDVAVDYLSPEQEAQLHHTLDIDWDMGEEVKPDEQAKLQKLVDSLKPCLALPYPITVSLVKSDIVNAMAVPGGKMVVFSGLLDAVSSTNGLIFVLAHELGHFKNRDHLRLMGRGIVLTILAMLTLGGDSGFSDILASTINIRTAKYSQTRESQADRTALQALQCHFGHVGGATELFESLQSRGKGIDLGLTHYFDSHPELQQRIDDLNRLSHELGYAVQDTQELIEP
ncbi:MAG: M48 family metallopeptidase [Nitrospirota bacterium]|nr:M48 family metallopeptidase [Nitrospirota bacterium]MDH5586385.1 M48 family metallopeptidase [Nitrospirota bacterium]MDH5774246.1 M48 family metallopeptidase [Nitrospirota bacterium]